MPEVGEELAPSRLDRLETGGHRVERRGERVELGAQTRLRYPYGVPALGELGGRVGEGTDAATEAPGEIRADGQRGRQRREYRQAQRDGVGRPRLGHAHRPPSLVDTSGHPVHLADYRGHPVVLYFSEGAGCQSCLYQMAAIEQHAADFRAANVPVLPIVMNSAAQIRADMAANHVTTPFLLDTDGTVSRAYGTGHVAAAPAMAAAVDGAHPGHAEDGEYLQEGDHDPEDLHPPGHWWR